MHAPQGADPSGFVPRPLSGGQRCVAFQTRRHWLFGTQAVACGCIEGRAGGSPVEPPDFAELPKRLGGPKGPKAPETEPEREDV